MRLLAGAFICTSLGLAAPAIAADTGASSGAPPAPQATAGSTHKGLDPNRIICKREAVTGSRIGGDEICLTWAQWDQIKQDDQYAFRRLSQTPTPPRAGGMAP